MRSSQSLLKKRGPFDGVLKTFKDCVGGPLFAEKRTNKIQQMGGPTGMLDPGTQGLAPSSISKEPIQSPFVRKVPQVTAGTANVDAIVHYAEPKGQIFHFFQPGVAVKKSVKLADSPAFKRHGAAGAALLTSRRNPQNPVAQANLIGFAASLEFARTRTFMENKPTHMPQFENSDPIENAEINQYFEKYQEDHMPGLKAHNNLGPTPLRAFPRKAAAQGGSVQSLPSS